MNLAKILRPVVDQALIGLVNRVVLPKHGCELVHLPAVDAPVVPAADAAQPGAADVALQIGLPFVVRARVRW